MNIQIELPKEYKELMQSIFKEIKELREEISLQKTNKLLNRSQASKFLGMTWQQLETISIINSDKKTNKQTIPCCKVGKNYKYKMEDLEEFKRANNL